MRTNSGIYLGRLVLLSVIGLFSGRDGKAVERPALSLASFGTAGGKEDTALIQRALDACSAQGRALRIPAMKKPYRVGPLRIPSKSYVTFESGVVLQAVAGFREFQKLINIVDVRDVELSGYGAVLRMNKTEYKTGEYRHCVFIAGSTNVEIEGLTCADAGGDGFYISGGAKKPFSENVTIAGVKADGSKRQGLTVISARNLVVRKSLFTRASGVTPEGGIDIEPESAGDRLERIRIEDNVTESNAGDGIRIALSKLGEKSPPVELTVSRHRDKASGKSSLFATNETNATKHAYGTLLVDRFSSENARLYGMVFSFWNSSGPSVTVRDASILNANQGHATDDNTAIGIIRGGGGLGTIGNIKFQRISIRDTAKNPAIDYYYTFVDYSRQGLNKVLFSEPGLLSGARHEHPLGLFQGQPVDAIEASDDSHLSQLWRRAEAIEMLRQKTSRLVSFK
jgi:Right handed beta helix region